MATSILKFDTERFISEVQSRIAIWNTNAEEYSDLELKNKCWIEIVNIFFAKPDASAAEVSNVAKYLMQRWEIMKSEYLTEYHQRLSYTKSGLVLNDQPPYKCQYYKQLSFLQPVLPVSPNCLSVLQEEHNDFKEIVDVLRAGFKLRTDIEVAKENDGDRLFLLSLVDSMKIISERLKLSIKMQIIQVIDNVCKLDEPTQGCSRTVGKSQGHPKNPNVMTQPKKKKKDDLSSANVKEIADELRMGFRQQVDVEISRENDGDRLFLLSLLNSMKKVPEILKLSVKIQIMQVIDNGCRVVLPVVTGHNLTQATENPIRIVIPVTQEHNRTEDIDNASRADVSVAQGNNSTQAIDNASRADISVTQGHNRARVIDNASKSDVSVASGHKRKSKKSRRRQRKDSEEDQEQDNYTNASSSNRSYTNASSSHRSYTDASSSLRSPGSTVSRRSSDSYDSDTSLSRS